VTPPRTRVLVVGGGLAGITAAIRLADAACAVTLVEAKPKLGGLTHSFRRGDLDVDNGQHVFMRCCTAYRALLDRLGVTDKTMLQERLDVPLRHVDGRVARLRRNNLPAPLHLGNSLLRLSMLSPTERLRAIGAALAMRGVDRNAATTDERALGEWLEEHRQSAASIDALWDLVGVATMNAHARDVSLATAAMVFQVGLLTDASAADLGWSLVPLQQLHGDAALRVLSEAGADVRLRSKVDALTQVGDSWRVALDGEAIEADCVVLATEHDRAERLLPVGALDVPPGWSAALSASPIVNVHLVFDRPVMSEPFLAGVGTPVQWIFDRTQQAGLTSGQYIALSLSAATDLIGASVSELRDQFVPAVRRLLPAASGAELRDFFVTREPRATFLPAPGTAKLRPPTATSLPGLLLAGAYTATGWPATMESAVRSGDMAAAAVLSYKVPEQRTVAA
jgi:squalene-associated FAD-dependent desaturase